MLRAFMLPRLLRVVKRNRSQLMQIVSVHIGAFYSSANASALETAA
jgi:hypothetical protein